MSHENLRSLFQLVVRHYGLLNEQCCDQCCGQDVSVQQSHILFEVGRQHHPSMRDIANTLGVDITTFSRQVKSLINKGYITKTPHPDDQRIQILQLTEKGAQLEKDIDQYMNESLDQIFSQLNEDERQTVTYSIDLLNKAMRSV
ncbi:MarR family winged helix-turn-helix transcriptional regulator [Piscibacillus halophilus]|uniref:DNA-binding transcriptional regulator, MarR family n=1 Tax=Piscibacillus halophilus TaxID=571933 RepID=A0A1H9FJQ3_9BACI|nr:MarR family transcriptional regulator [Piscibacillus halophilus]SEQ38142.1 DNA-binding transcriptional regulator, MarR family [Piscibacillus halophilus]